MEGKQLTPVQILDGQIRSDKMIEKIRAVLPGHINEDAFIVNAVKYCSQGKKVMQANRDSVIYAIIDAAKAGVLLDGKEAFINVYNNQAVMQTMYTGNAKSKKVQYFGAFMVYENDSYEGYMSMGGADFKFSMARGDRGKPEMAVAWTVEGCGFKRLIEIPNSRLDYIKQKEKNKAEAIARKYNKTASGPWFDSEDGMKQKHSLNVLFNYVLAPDEEINIEDMAETVDQDTGEIEEIEINKPSTNLTAAQIAVNKMLEPRERQMDAFEDMECEVLSAASKYQQTINEEV